MSTLIKGNFFFLSYTLIHLPFSTQATVPRWRRLLTEQTADVRRRDFGDEGGDGDAHGAHGQPAGEAPHQEHGHVSRQGWDGRGSVQR